jgi:hypothetical protein
MQRLLHPVDAEALEFPGDTDRIFQRPGRIGVPGHAPALIAVDHQLEPVADPIAHGLERADVGPPVAAVEADLHRRESLGKIALRGAGERVRAAQGSGRSERPPTSFQQGWPMSLPARSHSARSSGQQRPRWKLMLLRMR